MNGFFPGQQQHKGPKKCASVTHSCSITLDEAFIGCIKKFNVSKETLCNTCNKSCSVCGGRGVEVRHLQMGPMTQVIQTTCATCTGLGKYKSGNDKCSTCNSTDGKNIINQVIEISIPRSVPNGAQFVVEGWGKQPIKDNDIPGDLIITLSIKDHPLFTRQGSDLFSQIDISFHESIIGKDISIDVFGENVHLNTSKEFGVLDPRKDYVIPQKGLYHTDHDHDRGNLILKFDIKYPQQGEKDHQIIINLLQNMQIRS